MLNRIKLETLSGKIVLILMLAPGIGFGPSLLNAQSTSIVGIVRDASGNPLAGALVKVSNEEQGAGFLVVMPSAKAAMSLPQIFLAVGKLPWFWKLLVVIIRACPPGPLRFAMDSR